MFGFRFFDKSKLWDVFLCPTQKNDPSMMEHVIHDIA